MRDRTDGKGAVKTNDLMQTNVGHIYAIGDATGKLMLAHMASRQGIVAVDAIRGLKTRQIQSRYQLLFLQIRKFHL